MYKNLLNYNFNRLRKHEYNITSRQSSQVNHNNNIYDYSEINDLDNNKYTTIPRQYKLTGSHYLGIQPCYESSNSKNSHKSYLKDITQNTINLSYYNYTKKRSINKSNKLVPRTTNSCLNEINKLRQNYSNTIPIDNIL